jgi:hypothetical protein
VLFAFLYCALLKEDTVKYYSKVIIIGAAISLFFYPIQLVAPNVIYGFGEWINLPPRVGNPEYTNFLVFTFDKGHAIRNCGFAWEPGAYGCFLIIGLMLHFLHNNFKWDKGAIIITIATITSLSTTAYLGLMLAYLIYYRVNGGRLGPFLFFAVPILAVVAIEVPFLFDKIGKTYEVDQQSLAGLDGMNSYYEQNVDQGQIHLNRFASATLLFQLFRYHMILGIANGYQGAAKILKNVNISNGDADFMAKYGIVGLGFLLYRFGLLFKNFIYKNEYVFYCVIVFIALSFGEPMPMFHSTLIFLFLYHYVNPDTLAKRREQDEENEAEENKAYEDEEDEFEHAHAPSTSSN